MAKMTSNGRPIRFKSRLASHLHGHISGLYDGVSVDYDDEWDTDTLIALQAAISEILLERQQPLSE